MVLLEQPLAVSIKDAMQDVFANTPFMDCIKWHDESVFIHVMDMRTWKLVKTRYVINTCFMLHFANCYEEEDGSIVIDFPSYTDPKMLRFMFIDKLKAVNGTNVQEACDLFVNSMKRVVLPLPATETSAEVTVSTKIVSDATGVENPVVNPNYRRRRHRYVYGSGHSPSAKNYGRIVKIDMDSNEAIWFFEEDLYFSEVIFLPKPGAEAAEDDGVLVCSASYSSKPKDGCLVMLDTRTLKEVARVAFTALADVPMPLHGIFLPINAAGSASNCR